jgi:hypothetical protein
MIKKKWTSGNRADFSEVIQQRPIPRRIDLFLQGADLGRISLKNKSMYGEVGSFSFKGRTLIHLKSWCILHGIPNPHPGRLHLGCIVALIQKTRQIDRVSGGFSPDSRVIGTRLASQGPSLSRFPWNRDTIGFSRPQSVAISPESRHPARPSKDSSPDSAVIGTRSAS